jgi:hypothetical protein
MKTMKAFVLGSAASLALALAIYAQTPEASPTSTPAPAATVAPVASVSPAVSASSSVANQFADKIKERVDRKFKHGKFGLTIDDEDKEGADRHSSDDIPESVLPIVGIVMLTVFGAPVLIVAVIMYFGFSKGRMMHRTVRLLVEKGQPVPEALLNPPPAQRQRSEMRRGVVLVMVGLGLTLFLGAVSEWESGWWTLGIIPFLIGAGYLLVWKLEGRKDIPPPLP